MSKRTAGNTSSFNSVHMTRDQTQITSTFWDTRSDQGLKLYKNQQVTHGLNWNMTSLINLSRSSSDVPVGISHLPCCLYAEQVARYNASADQNTLIQLQSKLRLFFLSCVLIVVIFVFISFLLSGLSLRDTYWVIRGLLLCEMTSTVKGTLENFFSLVETYGFVPNGARIYYERRSQPPFLTLMVREYYRATG